MNRLKHILLLMALIMVPVTIQGASPQITDGAAWLGKADGTEFEDKGTEDKDGVTYKKYEFSPSIRPFNTSNCIVTITFPDLYDGWEDTPVEVDPNDYCLWIPLPKKRNVKLHIGPFQRIWQLIVFISDNDAKDAFVCLDNGGDYESVENGKIKKRMLFNPIIDDNSNFKGASTIILSKSDSEFVGTIISAESKDGITGDPITLRWENMHSSYADGGKYLTEVRNGDDKNTPVIRFTRADYDSDAKVYRKTFKGRNELASVLRRNNTRISDDYTHKISTRISADNDLKIGTIRAQMKFADAESNQIAGIANQGAVATFYRDGNYGGYAVSLDLGEYDVDRMQSYGITDNDISSLKVKSGYKVVAFKDDNFSGDDRTFTQDTPSVGSEWNDKISSLKVEYNNGVVMFADSDERGHGFTFAPGSYTLARMKQCGVADNSISSIRVPSGMKVTVYKGDNFSGASKTYVSNISNLTSDGFNDQISSFIVESNNAATFYQHGNYNQNESDKNGYAITLGPGAYTRAELENYGISNDDISSLKVNSGYKVIAYKDNNFSGDSRVFDSGINVDFSGDAWNDQISSLRILDLAAPSFYGDRDYKGNNSSSLGLGTYTTAQLTSYGLKDNDISSILVPTGYKVTVYKNDNFSGDSKTYTSSSNFVGGDWNDKISSIKVELIDEDSMPDLESLTITLEPGWIEPKITEGYEHLVFFGWNDGAGADTFKFGGVGENATFWKEDNLYNNSYQNYQYEFGGHNPKTGAFDSMLSNKCSITIEVPSMPVGEQTIDLTNDMGENQRFQVTKRTLHLNIAPNIIIWRLRFEVNLDDIVNDTYILADRGTTQRPTFGLDASKTSLASSFNKQEITSNTQTKIEAYGHFINAAAGTGDGYLRFNGWNFPSIYSTPGTYNTFVEEGHDGEAIPKYINISGAKSVTIEGFAKIQPYLRFVRSSGMLIFDTKVDSDIYFNRINYKLEFADQTYNDKTEYLPSKLTVSVDYQPLELTDEELKAEGESFSLRVWHSVIMDQYHENGWGDEKKFAFERKQSDGTYLFKIPVYDAGETADEIDFVVQCTLASWRTDRQALYFFDMRQNNVWTNVTDYREKFGNSRIKVGIKPHTIWLRIDPSKVGDERYDILFADAPSSQVEQASEIDVAEYYDTYSIAIPANTPLYSLLGGTQSTEDSDADAIIVNFTKRIASEGWYQIKLGRDFKLNGRDQDFYFIINKETSGGDVEQVSDYQFVLNNTNTNQEVPYTPGHAKTTVAAAVESFDRILLHVDYSLPVTDPNKYKLYINNDGKLPVGFIGDKAHALPRLKTWTSDDQSNSGGLNNGNDGSGFLAITQEPIEDSAAKYWRFHQINEKGEPYAYDHEFASGELVHPNVFYLPLGAEGVKFNKGLREAIRNNAFTWAERPNDQGKTHLDFFNIVDEDGYDVGNPMQGGQWFYADTWWCANPRIVPDGVNPAETDDWTPNYRYKCGTPGDLVFAEETTVYGITLFRIGGKKYDMYSPRKDKFVDGNIYYLYFETQDKTQKANLYCPITMVLSGGPDMYAKVDAPGYEGELKRYQPRELTDVYPVLKSNLHYESADNLKTNFNNRFIDPLAGPAPVLLKLSYINSITGDAIYQYEFGDGGYVSNKDGQDIYTPFEVSTITRALVWQNNAETDRMRSRLYTYYMNGDSKKTTVTRSSTLDDPKLSYKRFLLSTNADHLRYQLQALAPNVELGVSTNYDHNYYSTNNLNDANRTIVNANNNLIYPQLNIHTSMVVTRNQSIDDAILKVGNKFYVEVSINDEKESNKIVDKHWYRVISVPDASEFSGQKLNVVLAKLTDENDTPDEDEIDRITVIFDESDPDQVSTVYEGNLMLDYNYFMDPTNATVEINFNGEKSQVKTVGYIFGTPKLDFTLDSDNKLSFVDASEDKNIPSTFSLGAYTREEWYKHMTEKHKADKENFADWTDLRSEGIYVDPDPKNPCAVTDTDIPAHVTEKGLLQHMGSYYFAHAKNQPGTKFEPRGHFLDMYHRAYITRNYVYPAKPIFDDGVAPSYDANTEGLEWADVVEAELKDLSDRHAAPRRVNTDESNPFIVHPYSAWREIVISGNPTAIDDAEADKSIITVMPGIGEVTVTGTDSIVRVYTFTGATAYTGQAGRISLAPGTYIVLTEAGSTTVRVL